MYLSSAGERDGRRRELAAALPFLLALGALAALWGAFLFPPSEAYARGHDFLDSIFPLYVVRARIPDFFFDFSAVVPQLADGLPFNALGMGDFALGPNLYLLLPPFWAYAANEAARRLLALVGAYLLLTRYVLPGHPSARWIAAATALSFAALPDQANRFGTISMLPLLFWASLNLWRGERRLTSWAVVILYPFCSFLYLGGFTICGYLLVASLVAWRLQLPTRSAVVGAFVYTVAAYVLIEARMFHQWFVQSDYQSYRHFVEHGAASFSALLAQFLSEFVYGDNANHVTRHSPLILMVTAATALVLIARLWRPAEHSAAVLSEREFRRRQVLFWLLLGLTSANAAVNALDQAGFFNFKYALGFPFSFHRIDVTSPLVWRLLLALSIVLLAAALGRRMRPFVYAFFALVIAHSLLQFPGAKEELKRAVGAPKYAGLTSLLTGSYPPPPRFVNAKTSYHPGYTRLGEYYMEDAFVAIRPALAAEIGDPSRYRTASLGLPPSVSLYQGFRPIDGLFYDVSADYAKAFARLTAPEYAKDGLEPNERTGGLILHVSPRSFASEGIEFAFETCRFAEMGGRVLFSMWPILNASELQLRPFGDFGGVRVYLVAPGLRC